MRIPTAMAKNDLGKTIKDELTLCYDAEPRLLEDLSSVGIGDWLNFDEFSMYRVVSRHFQYAFDVLYGASVDSRIKLATIRFGHYGEQEQSLYVYYRLENKAHYDPELFDIALRLPDMLGLSFRHTTSMDLCRDFKCNVVQRIRKVAKDDAVTVIVNGKAIDKSEDVAGSMLVYSLNFNRVKNPTISIKQAKAIKDKSKGLTMCAYDKSNEIMNASGKDYIKEFYGNPKSLHRLEIHMNNQEIKDYCKNVLGVTQDLSMLRDQKFLDGIYEYHLSSLLRFTKCRKRLDWNDILCSGRV